MWFLYIGFGFMVLRMWIRFDLLIGGKKVLSRVLNVNFVFFFNENNHSKARF